MRTLPTFKKRKRIFLASKVSAAPKISMKHTFIVRKVFAFSVVALLWVALVNTGPVWAQEFSSKKLSFVEYRQLNVNLDLGFTQLVSDDNVSSDPGFAMALQVSRAISASFDLGFGYQLSWFNMNSPDPFDPNLSLSKRVKLNQPHMFGRLFLTQSRLRPYVQAGLGLYNFRKIDQETALSFSRSLYIPVGVGVRWHMLKDILSLGLSSHYSVFLGEDQAGQNLSLLGLDKVSFGQLTHFFRISLHAF